MKSKFIITTLILLLLTGCKDLEVPDLSELDISKEDVNKAFLFGSKVYDAAKDVTPEQEYYIGRSVAATILQKYKLYNNSYLNRYVNSVGRLLTLNSDQPEIFGGYHFAVLDSSEINAFATPGGIIFVTRGIIKMCKNEDELAAVLAHEISHVELKHGISSIKDSRWTAVATMLGSEVAERYTSEDIATLTKSFKDSIGDVVNTLVVNGYSRKYELAADKNALTILKRSGYAESAILSMLERMKSRLKTDKRGFGSTHPDTSERIEVISRKIGTSKESIPTVRTNRFKTYIKYV